MLAAFYARYAAIYAQLPAADYAMKMRAAMTCDDDEIERHVVSRRARAMLLPRDAVIRRAGR